jgi:transposase
MLICHSCGAEIQQGWEACPMCGNRVDASAGASLNITDTVVNKVDRSQTVDWSVPIGGDVSGTLITFNL